MSQRNKKLEGFRATISGSAVPYNFLHESSENKQACLYREVQP